MNKLARIRAMIGAAAVLAGLLRSTGAAQLADRQVLRGDRVAVYNLAGSIRLEGTTSGSDVVVTVSKRGADGPRLKVETGNVRGREALRVIFPDERIVFAGSAGADEGGRWGTTRLDVDKDGTFGDSKHDWDRGSRVEIASSGRGFHGYADVSVMVPKGKRIEVYLAAGMATVSNIDGDVQVDVSAASVTTTHTRGVLSLDTGSGDVTVTDALGDVILDSGSGSAKLTGVRGTELRLDTGSGSLSATDVTVDKLTGDTGSGRVRLVGIRAKEIILDSGSGSVELELLEDVERVRIDAGSGSVTIGVPESLGATVDIDTGSGGIDIDIPVTVTRRDRDSLKGSIGDGRGRISIESGSGGVHLRRSAR